MTLTQRLKKLAKLEASPYLREPDCVCVSVRIYPAREEFESHAAWFETCRIASRVPIVDAQPEPAVSCDDVYRFDAAKSAWVFRQRVAW